MSLDTELIDWDAPRTPCQTEGCNWPNFHVCLVGKEDRFEEALANEATRKKNRASRAGMNGRAVWGSDEHREKLRQSQNEIWADHHAANEERNKEIVRQYAAGKSMRQLRKEFELGHGTLVKILHDARDRGEVTIRPRYYEHGKLVG